MISKQQPICDQFSILTLYQNYSNISDPNDNVSLSRKVSRTTLYLLICSNNTCDPNDTYAYILFDFVLNQKPICYDNNSLSLIYANLICYNNNNLQLTIIWLLNGILSGLFMKSWCFALIWISVVFCFTSFIILLNTVLSYILFYFASLLFL